MQVYNESEGRRNKFISYRAPQFLKSFKLSVNFFLYKMILKLFKSYVISFFFFQETAMRNFIMHFICFMCITVWISSPVLPYFLQNVPKGQPTRLCNRFGCACQPPPGARCCIGYRYDPRSQMCRETIK